MLAVGRAPMGKPKLLLMDEPSQGLSPVRSINRLGVGVILVEQNVRLALEVAETVYVLHLGRIIQKGSDGRFMTTRIGRAHAREEKMHTGHFYFAKNRTFLLCVDTLQKFFLQYAIRGGNH